MSFLLTECDGKIVSGKNCHSEILRNSPFCFVNLS